LKEYRENNIDDDQPDLEKEDEYDMRKERLHAWVYLQPPKRELETAFFIEPTTGRWYSKETAPYFTVEAVFNNHNFWINLDPTRSIDELNMDF